MSNKNKKTRNPYKQRVRKGLNLNINVCKKQAMSDITQDCGQNKFFTRNYVTIEHVVLASCAIMQEVIPIVNHRLYTY